MHVLLIFKEESAIWLTANATPVNESNPVENDDDDSGKVVDEKLYLDGTKVSFATFELKTSSVSVCIIDDCKDADVPLRLLEILEPRLAEQGLAELFTKLEIPLIEVDSAKLAPELLAAKGTTRGKR